MQGVTSINGSDELLEHSHRMIAVRAKQVAIELRLFVELVRAQFIAIRAMTNFLHQAPSSTASSSTVRAE